MMLYTPWSLYELFYSKEKKMFSTRVFSSWCTGSKFFGFIPSDIARFNQVTLPLRHYAAYFLKGCILI